MRLAPVLLLAAALVAGCDTGDGRDEPAPPAPSQPQVTRPELNAHLNALERIADENGGTRAAGTPGYDASVDYVAARMRELGWRVHRQSLRFPYFELRSASLRVRGGRLRRERDFQVLSYSGSGRVAGRLRAAGDGCSAADFAGLARGEIPMVMRSGCFFREKALAAERAGAEALLVTDTVRSRRGIFSGTLAGPGVDMPALIVSNRSLRGVGAGARVSIAVDALSETRDTQNVIAETPGGSDERIVMAGGHLDSVQGGPGINDNGSGVATLIEAAERISPRPRGGRVRIAFWAAEELGLAGSRHYVRSLDRADRRRIRAYLNLDMVGSPNAVPELYADSDPRLDRALRRAAGIRLGEVSAGVGSDHAPFASAGIPVNGLYTGGPEPSRGGPPRDPCYHLSCDSAENVDRRVLLRMARTAAAAMRSLSRQAK